MPCSEIALRIALRLRSMMGSRFVVAQREKTPGAAPPAARNALRDRVLPIHPLSLQEARRQHHPQRARTNDQERQPDPPQNCSGVVSPPPAGTAVLAKGG